MKSPTFSKNSLFCLTTSSSMRDVKEDFYGVLLVIDSNPQEGPYPSFNTLLHFLSCPFSLLHFGIASFRCIDLQLCKAFASRITIFLNHPFFPLWNPLSLHSCKEVVHSFWGHLYNWDPWLILGLDHGDPLFLGLVNRLLSSLGLETLFYL